MGDGVGKVEGIVVERDAMRLRTRYDDPVGFRAWLGDLRMDPPGTHDCTAHNVTNYSQLSLYKTSIVFVQR